MAIPYIIERIAKLSITVTFSIHLVNEDIPEPPNATAAYESRDKSLDDLEGEYTVKPVFENDVFKKLYIAIGERPPTV
ncbi:hypothetical protein, partial [Bacillus subtilis]|uniref:hypothetical protein n=1 Tax=Bacillus subtilis TaxID=1423 RepID=UPI003F7BE1CB